MIFHVSGNRECFKFRLQLTRRPTHELLLITVHEARIAGTMIHTRSLTLCRIYRLIVRRHGNEETVTVRDREPSLLALDYGLQIFAKTNCGAIVRNLPFLLFLD